MSGIVSLILAERAYNSQWLTVLNEMRLNRELPQWLAHRDVGTTADGDRYSAAQCATNMAIFGAPLVLAGEALSVIENDRQTVIDLIEAERTFAIRWWTALNDLRRKGQLPGWALSLSVGHGPDMERWHEKAGAVNLVLFGTEYVRELMTTARAAAPRLKEMLT